MADANLEEFLKEAALASKRLKGRVEETAVLTNGQLDKASGTRNVRYKCENFQKSGGYKYRGAINCVLKLKERLAAEDPNGEKPLPHLVTHGTGNFTQALALAANEEKFPCTVVMPRNAFEIKRHDCRIEYKANLVDCEFKTHESREAKCKEVLSSLASQGTAAVFIDPIDNEDVIIGQATCMAEFLANFPEMDTIVSVVGDGTMLAGVCLAVKLAKRDDIKIYGAEPKNVQVTRSKNGTNESTIADSLMAPMGEKAKKIIDGCGVEYISVTEDEIEEAMCFCFKSMKLVIEATTAVVVAAVMTQEFRNLSFFSVQNVGIILCGGNVDIQDLSFIMKGKKASPKSRRKMSSCS